MSLKSIRASYSKLLATFNDAGIKLNESQKSDLDSFVLALESTMSNQRESTIRKTKKVVSDKLESEYKKIFESVMKNMRRNSELASKIQNISTKIQESKKIAKEVNDYLDLHVESVLPEKTIIDYDKMQKYEKIQESLKDILVVNEETVINKMKQLEESLKTEKSKCQTEVAKIQVKLNESMKQAAQLKSKLEHFKSAELLESKTKDLPSYEARKIKKLLSEASTDEIEEKFDDTLDKVRSDAKKEAEDQETTIDSEINDIINDENEDKEDNTVEENDMLRGRVHNNHIVEADVDDHCVESDDEASEDPEEEEFETTETVNFDDDGDVELDESEVIGADAMKYYCSLAMERT